MLILAITFLTQSLSNAQELLTNGGFESGDLTGWESEGNVFVGDTTQNACCIPFQGSYFVAFNGGDTPATGKLSQSIETLDHGIYELSFAFGKGGPGGGIASLRVSVQGKNLRLEELVSDTNGGQPGNYSTFLFTFVSDSKNSILCFEDVSSGTLSFDALIDSVSIQQAGFIGDINCDGNIDLLDVAPFVETLTGGGFFEKADINQDGEVNLLDVAPFVDLLSGG
ncbi:MAG: dockerin type I domain-containing protein [Planctomycetota bacterium]